MKYEEMYKPLYDKRLKVVEGSEEVKGEDISAEASKVNISDLNASNSEKGIPDFWGLAISNCYQFKALINNNDRKVLLALRDIRVIYLENNSFTLVFYFDKNDFFDHDTLTKTYRISPQTGTIFKIESTEIQWKSEDINPTIEKKKKKMKKKNEIKTITKVEEVASFFNFFKSYEIKGNKTKEEKKPTLEEEEEEEENEIDIIEDEYDLGLFVKDDFIPFAIEYYLGINPEEGDDYEDEEIESEEEDNAKENTRGKKVFSKKY